ncbi:MAG TPA: hypothetical protein VLM76_04755 [Patescibacteria group bacterium]|nr:hypothetical protein [Patescibacteria group bacterium]
MFLVYDPQIVTDPASLGQSLGIGVLVAGIPPAYAGRYDFPPAGYLVARETWAGLDVLPGPVTPEAIAALPDPGPDPAVDAAVKQAEVHGILDILRTTPINPAALDANLVLLARARAIPDPPTGDIAALATFLPVSSPTLAQTAAATKALIRVLANYAEVVPAQRATINVLADTIRFLLQR